MKVISKHFTAILALAAAVVATAAQAAREFGTKLLFGPDASLTPTGDVAIKFRVDGGIPGDLSRTHPFDISPHFMNQTTPVKEAGDAVFLGTASDVRAVAAGDGSATPGKLYGIMARAYPTQQMTGGPGSSFGISPINQQQPADVIRYGYVTVKLPAGATVKKGDPVQVWAAATSGSNIQGKFVAAASSTNTFTATNAIYNGPADANGNVEIQIWP